MQKQSTNKRHSGTRFRAVKHPGTFPFHPGNEAIEADRVPAFNSSGRKEYKRILPPIRDRRIIDFEMLAQAIQKIAPGNIAEPINAGIILNGETVSVKKTGLATVNKLIFRFNDCREFIDNLQKERILNCSPDECYFIEVKYKQLCYNH